MPTYPPTRHHRLVIGLHWFMALLIAAAYAAIELREFFPKGSDPRLLMKTIHYGLGLSVLALVSVRLLARFLSHTPAIVPALPKAQHLMSQLMHLALYGFMLLMPLLGWLLLSAKGEHIQLFGVQIPALIAENIELEDLFEALHETLGSIGYGLIGLHVLAGLFHHYVRRDNTLARMLPWLKH